MFLDQCCNAFSVRNCGSTEGGVQDKNSNPCLRYRLKICPNQFLPNSKFRVGAIRFFGIFNFTVVSTLLWSVTVATVFAAVTSMITRAIMY